MSFATDISPGDLRRGSDVQSVLGFPPIAELPARDEVSDAVFDEYLLRLARELVDAYQSRAAHTFLLTAISAETNVEPLAAALEMRLQAIGVDAFAAPVSDLLPPAALQDAERESGLWQQGYAAANVARLRGAHQLVLLHAEALTRSPEARHVARSVDAIVLVIECGVGLRAELQQTASLLARLHATGIATAVAAEVLLEDADEELRSGVVALEKAANEAAATPAGDATPEADRERKGGGSELPPARQAGSPLQPDPGMAGTNRTEALAQAPASPGPGRLRTPLDTPVTSFRTPDTSRPPATPPPGTMIYAAAGAEADAEHPPPTIPPLPEAPAGSTRAAVRSTFAGSRGTNDVEPVAREVSRRPTTGRWDPIPTLRQPNPGRRERATPVPPMDRAAFAAGQDDWPDDRTEVREDGTSRGTRWAPETSAAYRAESLPEPLLTRQWGLLSRFQRERLTTARGTVDASPGDSEFASPETRRKERAEQE